MNCLVVVRVLLPRSPLGQKPGFYRKPGFLIKGDRPLRKCDRSFCPITYACH
ncbi:MAG: hypothetical protein AB4352_16270 [Hormoscilla sp.]